MDLCDLRASCAVTNCWRRLSSHCTKSWDCRLASEDSSGSMSWDNEGAHG